MKDEWLGFTYREFYDIPRAIVLRWEGTLYFFDCPFSDDIDDYPDFFTVYRLPSILDAEPDGGSWADLAARGTRIGRVAVSDIEFDDSKRARLRAAVFQRIRTG